MPKEMEDKLKKEAAKKGLTGERAGKFVYGTLRKTGWVPSQQKGNSDKKKAVRNSVIKGRLLKNSKR